MTKPESSLRSPRRVETPRKFSEAIVCEQRLLGESERKAFAVEKSETAPLQGPAQLAALKAIGRFYLSPLRYPGGKRKLVKHMAALMDAYDVTRVDRILEPFAGGAAMSIAFLEAGLAGEAVLNDLDPIVADFWSVVFSSHGRKLADRVLDANVDLRTWETLRQSNSSDPVDRAFKCLFLNRTSFSGSISPVAGPLGGKSQIGPNSIGCRWNAKRLALRIEELGSFADRVRVRCADFRRFVGSFKSGHARRPGLRVLWYLDPPFFHKADRLYRYWFEEADHHALARCLDRLDGMWMLSYDNCTEARAMYRDHPGRSVVDMRYSAAIHGPVQRLDYAELIVTSLTPQCTAAPFQVRVANVRKEQDVT